MNYKYVSWMDELNQFVSINTAFMSRMSLGDVRVLIAELETAKEKLERLEDLEHASKLAQVRSNNG